MLQNCVLQNLMAQNLKENNLYSRQMHFNFKMVHRVYAQHYRSYCSSLSLSTCFHLILAKQKETVKKTFLFVGTKKALLKSSDVTKLGVMIVFSSGCSVSIRNLHLITLYPKRGCAVMSTATHDSVQ